MVRQERLSLFLAKEQEILTDLLKQCFGFCGLIVSGHGFSATLKYPTQHAIKASGRAIQTTDLVLDYQNFPFANDYFDFIILDHVFDETSKLTEVLSEVARVLRPNGVLLISGFERLRLCARMLQKRFAKNMGTQRKPYSLLDLQARLLALQFRTEVQHFDFSRTPGLERMLRHLCPFLGVGFWIVAKQEVSPLKLVEDWSFMPKITQLVDPRPEYYTPPEKS